MSYTTRTIWVMCGLAIACTASTAIAAQNNGKAVKQHMQATQKGHFVSPPRTMVQADATQVRLANGAVGMQLATELWSHVAVQKDAHGNLHQVEVSSDVAPTGILEGASNE